MPGSTKEAHCVLDNFCTVAEPDPNNKGVMVPTSGSRVEVYWRLSDIMHVKGAEFRQPFGQHEYHHDMVMDNFIALKG